MGNKVNAAVRIAGERVVRDVKERSQNWERKIEREKKREEKRPSWSTKNEKRGESRCETIGINEK